MKKVKFLLIIFFDESLYVILEMQHEFIVSRGTTTSGQQKQFPTKRLETQSQIVYNVLHTADMLSHRFMA